MTELATTRSSTMEVKVLSPELISKLVLKGDCSALTPEQKIEYMKYRCDQLGIDLAEGPFEFIRMNGKEIMYAKKSCTDALCRVRSITRTVTGKERIEDVYIVTAKATDATGRSDESTGAVPIANLKGEALANAIMKAETKAKRRAVLSLCGLGMLDESEFETIPTSAFQSKTSSRRPAVSVVDSTAAFVALGAPMPQEKPKPTMDEIFQGDDIPNWEPKKTGPQETLQQDGDRLSFPDFAVNHSDVLSVYNGVSLNELEIDDVRKIYDALCSLENKARKDESKQELLKLKKQARDALDLITAKTKEAEPVA